MKILFTGGSSFTGYWFVKELVAAGHEVVVPFRRSLSDYNEHGRRARIDLLIPICSAVFGVSFGDDRFLQLVKNGQWDLLCHHAAEVSDYRSADFNVVRAVENNCHKLAHVLDALSQSGCRKIVLTGSVFENDEGAGTEPREAFSPYGLSKGLTWQMFRHYAQLRDIDLGKFVIPNPFGPYEETRFIHYLVKNWFGGTVPAVNTPDYVRDNIPVSLLALQYARFAERLASGISRTAPSGYVESQGAFAKRVAAEMNKRLALPCDVSLNKQTDFSEPLVRINTETANANALNWNEVEAWDGFADYYARLFGKETKG
jgi:UDP-glucose 4-epimerase